MEKYTETKNNVMNAKLSSFLFYVFILLICVFLASGKVLATTSPPYDAMADTCIYQGTPSINFGSSETAAAGAYYDDEWAAYFKWNLSSLNNIIVTGVEVRLYCSTAPAVTLYPEVYKVTSSWSETGLDWDPQPSQASTDLGDPGLSSTGWFELTSDDSSGLIPVVQDWIDNPSGNFGLVFRQDPYGDDRVAEFRTQEYNNGSHTAQLIVTYTAADTTPPTPNPSQWLQEPFPTSTTSIQMSCQGSSDSQSLPVEYYFEFYTGSGGHDSSWISSNAYTDTGLTPNSSYGYRAKARDSSSNLNETSPTNSRSCYTYAATPPAPTVNNPTATTLDVTSLRGTNPIYTELAIYNNTGGYYVRADGGNNGSTPVWQKDYEWSTVSVTGLSPDTTYQFKVKARNEDLEVTSLGSAGSGTTASPPDTTPPTPNPSQWLQEPYPLSDTSIQMSCQVSTDSKSPPVKYYFQFYTGSGGHDSDWIDLNVYTDTGLTPNSSYGYRAKARDSSSNLNETIPTNSRSCYTYAAVPPAPTVDNPTDTTLDVTPLRGTNPIYTELAIYNKTDGYHVRADGGNNGSTPVWQKDYEWGTVTVTGLYPETPYEFQVKAINEDGIETLLGSEGSGTTGSSPNWILMYYYGNGDDMNIQMAATRKYTAIKSAAGNANFQAFMLWDKRGGGDDLLWKIQDGDDLTWTGPQIGLPAEEFAMGDPTTLYTFVDWVMDNYQADHYALIVFNHGHGIADGLCCDESDSALSIYELGSALYSIETMHSNKLDVLHLDACLMQMFEINYQVSDFVDYVVASENEGRATWGADSYENSYLDIITNTTSPVDLAITIAQAYNNHYTTGGVAHTISVLSQSYTDIVSNKLNSFAESLIDNIWDLRDLNYLSDIRHFVQKFDYDTALSFGSRSNNNITQSDDYLDLKDIAVETANRVVSIPEVQTAANELSSAIGNEGGDFVKFEEHLSVSSYNFDSGTYGVSIYWPDTADAVYQTYFDWSSTGLKLALTADTKWDEFLRAYLAWKALKVISSGAPNVSITCTTDELEHGDGVTPFTRVFELGKNVSLVAPPEGGGKPFIRWDRDGSSYSTDLTISFNMDNDYHFEAVYGMVPPTAVITSISPSPANPQTDTVEFREDSYDNDEAGFSIVAWEWSSNLGDWQGNTVLSNLQNPDIDANDLAVGTHTITLWVEDDEGETDTVTEALTISNVTPVIDSLNVIRTGTETVSITGTAHDRDEHQQSIIDWEITVSSDGYNNAFTVGSGNLDYNLDTSCLAAGSYTVSARAKDDENIMSDSVIGGGFDVNSLSPDIDSDGYVDFEDFTRLALRFLDIGCICPEWCESTDLDKSGSVDFGDVKILCDHWLEGIVSVDWWNTSWGYRQPVAITNNVETVLYDYSMKISLNTADLISQGKMQSDCGDIRIIENGQEIDYGITNPNSVSTEIYFIADDLIDGNNSDIYIYYGNPDANNGFVENWKDAFYTWYDDFDTDRGWGNCPGNTRPGTVTVDTVDGWLYAQWNQYNDYLVCPTDGSSFPMNGRAGFKAETRIMAENDRSCQIAVLLKNSSLTAGVPIIDFRVGHNDYSVLWDSDVPKTLDDDVWYEATAVYNRLTGDWYGEFANDGVRFGNRPAQPDDDFSIITFDICNNINMYLDYLYLRYFIEPEPSYSVGEEEIL